MKSVKGYDINAVIRTVRSLAPDDGDIQLSLLAYAFVTSCRSCKVEPAVAVSEIERIFESRADVELIPLDDPRLALS